MLAGAGADAFGGVNVEQEQAARQQGVMQGADTSTPEGLMAVAKRFHESGMPQQAAMAVQAARQMSAEQQKMQIELRMQNFAETEAYDLKLMEADARIRQNDERIRDARTSAAERAALMRDSNDIKRMLAQQNSNGQNKLPMGYRYKPDGTLEPIPGGPADIKAQAMEQNKAAGAAGIDSSIAGLRDAYNRLEEGGGITSTEKSAASNIAASTASSGVGQFFGKMVGTKNQSARNDIAMSRPGLLASIMKATGMSAKQIDSNAELKLWLSTATDPTLDVQANRRALDNIEQKYLSGNSPAQTTGGGWNIRKK